MVASGAIRNLYTRAIEMATKTRSGRLTYEELYDMYQNLEVRLENLEARLENPEARLEKMEEIAEANVQLYEQAKVNMMEMERKLISFEQKSQELETSNRKDSELGQSLKNAGAQINMLQGIQQLQRKETEENQDGVREPESVPEVSRATAEQDMQQQVQWLR